MCSWTEREAKLRMPDELPPPPIEAVHRGRRQRLLVVAIIAAWAVLADRAPVDADRELIHLVLGQFSQEHRTGRPAGDAVNVPPVGTGEGQGPLGPGHAHEAEPPFLLDVGPFGFASPVG